MITYYVSLFYSYRIPHIFIEIPIDAIKIKYAFSINIMSFLKIKKSESITCWRQLLGLRLHSTKDYSEPCFVQRAHTCKVSIVVIRANLKLLYHTSSNLLFWLCFRWTIYKRYNTIRTNISIKALHEFMHHLKIKILNKNAYHKECS